MENMAKMKNICNGVTVLFHIRNSAVGFPFQKAMGGAYQEKMKLLVSTQNAAPKVLPRQAEVLSFSPLVLIADLRLMRRAKWRQRRVYFNLIVSFRWYYLTP